MKRILFAGVCAFVLTGVSAMAQTGAYVTRDGVTHYGPRPQTTIGSSAAAAHNQALYGGNPDAGGGPRGSVQSTNNPRASREYGGR